MCQPWPTIALSEVYHVGSMDAAQKSRSISLEGNGLSVSLDPSAWRKIARLGEHPTWTLSTASPATFLDALALTDQLWQEVMQWAQSQGLVRAATLFKVSGLSEDDERASSLYDDAAQAQEEFDALMDDEADPNLEEMQGWCATPAMCERIGFEFPLLLVKDLALTLYAEDVLYEAQNVHGVWWDEQLDVYNFLTPRGVIHLRALRVWDHEQVHATEQNRNRP